MTPLIFACAVLSIHDGDSLTRRERINDKPIKVRLAAIDTPEMPGACRKDRVCAPGNPHRAKASLVKLAAGKTLRCERTGTSWGRITAWCRTAAGVDLSCAQFRAGFAVRLAQFDRDRKLCRR
jgi:endonuclease YncB( thermonuclease family)